MDIDLLAVGAHPDDIELTCGGTIAVCVKAGYSVGLVDLTEGEMGTRGNNKIRLQEAERAGKILGAKFRINLNLGDGRFENTEANRAKLITVIRKHRPKLLLIPHSGERHPDHVRAHHLCREAWFYAGLRKLETKDGRKLQQPWRPNNYIHFMQWQVFEPSFIVDISDVYDVRTKAILAHKSQFYNPGSTEPETLLSQKSFLDFVETRAKEYGYRIGVRYGEPFYSVEPIGIGDIFSLKMFKG
jgi:bacillithiol biosynthesis deacetylase BshB1